MPSRHSTDVSTTVPPTVQLDPVTRCAGKYNGGRRTFFATPLTR